MKCSIAGLMRGVLPLMVLLLAACGGGAEDPVPPNSDATLSGLTVSTGVLGPVFDPATLTYAVSVNNATASVTVTPTAGDAHATITGLLQAQRPAPSRWRWGRTRSASR
jgi:hypothetical protein